MKFPSNESFHLNYRYLRVIKLFCILAYSLFISFSLQAKPDEQEKNDLKASVSIEDLAYGNILFEYYRGNLVESLNQILVAQKRNSLPNHANNARLLSGVIYLDLGMLTHAQNIFNELLTEKDLSSGFFSKIEFYLGKLHYKQGDLQQAYFRLTRVVSTLETDLTDEALVILSNISLTQNDKDAAKNWLSQISQQSKLSAISQFNLGMLWLREQQIEKAERELNNIHQEVPDKDTQKIRVIKNLQDKAFLALGYYHLSNKKFELSRKYFRQIRLSSLSANKALLGIGWSYAEESNYNKALTHWIELSKRDIRDIAVQEVTLAIPYAYQKLNALKLALTHYTQASDRLSHQMDLIEQVLHKINHENLIENFVSKVVEFENGKLSEANIEDTRLVGDEFDYYLYELVAQHRFNEGFQNYQKLGQLAKILARWEEELPSFDEIVSANKKRFEEKIPQVDAYLAQGSFTKYQADLVQLEADIEDLKNNRNIHLMATPKELKLYQRIKSLEKKLTIIPDDMITNEQRLKAKRARSVLEWQILQNKAEKIWLLEKNALVVRDILNQMEQKKVTLASARDTAEVRFNGYQDKVDNAEQQLLGLRDKIKAQIAIQAEALKKQIIQVLEKRKATLDYYLLQSDLSVARMHEKALEIPELE